MKNEQQADDDLAESAHLVEWSAFSTQIRELRQEAFVVENGFAAPFINDDQDPRLFHLCVLANSQVVASLRFSRDGHVERFAIAPRYRNGAVLRALGRGLECEAKRLGIPRLWGYVQEKNMMIFERFGAQRTGRHCMVGGFDHVEMEKLLA